MNSTPATRSAPTFHPKNVVRRTTQLGVAHDLARKLGLEVHAADFGLVDMSEDNNVIQFGMKSIFAHLEHSGIRRKTLAARVAMAEAGRLPGGLSLYGYPSVKGITMAHPEQHSHLLRLFTLAAEGRSFNEIAEVLNQSNAPLARPTRKERYLEGGELKTRTVETRWRAGTVAGIIRNRSYLRGGHYTLSIPQIIPADLWHRAQRHRVGASTSLGWVFVGHIRCGRCGARMSGHRAHKPSGAELHRYRCNAQGGIGKHNCGAVLSRRKSGERVEAAVRKLFSDPVRVRALLEQPEPDDQETLLELADLEARSKEAFGLWRAGHITGEELGMIRSDIGERRAALQGARESLSYPVEEYMAAAQGLPLRELLELFDLVATLTKDDLSLAIERA